MIMQKARVLVALTVLDQRLIPNQVIEADEAIIKELAGQVDPSPEAVAYCLDNGGEIVTIQSATAEDDPPAGKEADQPEGEVEKPGIPETGTPPLKTSKGRGL